MPSYPQRREESVELRSTTMTALYRVCAGVLSMAVTVALAGCRVTIMRDAGDGGTSRQESGEGGTGGQGGRGGSGGSAGQPGEPGQPGQPGGGPTVQGSGNVVTEMRPVSGFDAVSFQGSAQLLIDQTGTESLAIEAEDNILPHLSSEVNGRRLVLGVKPNVSLSTTKPIVFRLSVKELKEIGASGSGDIDAKNLSTEALVIDQSGSFDMLLQGRAPRLQISLSGSGDLNAQNLDSSDAEVDLSGSGDVAVKASSRLSVRISGSGSVEFIGDPRVTQNINGSGTVRKR